MTIRMPRNLMTAISVVAFAVMLHGCGGGGGDSPVTTAPEDTTPPAGPMIAGETVPSGTTITLPAGHDLPNIVIPAAMDESVTVAGIGTFTCVNADGCSVDLTDGVITTNGDIKVVSLDVTDTGILAQLADAVAEPPAPTELETVQADAAKAATDARTVATDAQTAATEANTARENRAAIQTGDLDPDGHSGAHAKAAQGHADDADTAATDAETASAVAAEATTVRAATTALVAATTALDDATTAKGKAETSRDEAVTASTTEVKIVGADKKTKRVGGTSITIDGTASSRTINGVTHHTGLVNVTEAKAVTTPGMRDAHGRPVRFGEAVDGVVPMITGRTAATPSIAFTYDSDDDSARVTLVHSYLGSAKQMQFVRNADTNPFNGADGAGDLDDPANTSFDVTDGKINHDAEADTDPVAPKVAGSDFRHISALSTGVTLYYVPAVDDADTADHDESIGEDPTPDDGVDDTKMFLERNVMNGVTTYQLVSVIEVSVDNATGFKHLHYGLWNGISGTDVNSVADLGIGFVAAYGEAGMTQDMPNFGGATYDGNWVANIQAEDPEGDGAISRVSGVATLDADFVDNKVDVVLTGLAGLEGTIDGSTFEGSGKPKLPDDNLVGGLANTENFMGSFRGAFFGPKAAEAGGVFDYVSTDNKDGAFTGSFGGTR